MRKRLAKLALEAELVPSYNKYCVVHNIKQKIQLSVILWHLLLSINTHRNANCIARAQVTFSESLLKRVFQNKKS